MQLSFAELTHANTKKRVFVLPGQVLAVYHSEANACTHIISSAGTVIPVTESVEKTTREIINALGESQDG